MTNALNCPQPATTVGIIYPGHAAEDDYVTAADKLNVRLPVGQIDGTDLHARRELLDLGRPGGPAEAATRLAEHRPQGVMWAGTSGSFVYGLEGAEQQAQQVGFEAGVPVASTSRAFN